MRHFEFKDDKSNKFWQIEQSDSELNLRWGKIGTQGQNQSKHFDNEAKAFAAMTKLVKEKVGKGYVEVGADQNTLIGATAQNATTESAETISAESISDISATSTPPWLANGDPIAVPKKIMNQALTHRNRPGAKAKLNDKQSWAKLHDMLFRNDSLLTYFEATSPQLRNTYIASWQRFADGQMNGTIESDAMLFALASHVGNDGDRESSRAGKADITDFLVASKGLPYAIDVLLLAQEINVEIHCHPSNSLDCYSLNENITLPLSMGRECPYSPAELRFRKLLSGADEVEWQICVDKLIAGLPRLHFTRQPLIALLLPERPDIANRLAKEPIPDGDPCYASEILPWLQLVATDEVALESLSEASLSGYNYDHLDCEFGVATLIADRGLDAVPILAYRSGNFVACDALAYIGTPEAMTVLAQAIDHKSDQIRFMDAAHRWPLASIPAIAELLVTDPPGDEIVATCLTSLLMANAEQVDRLLPWMSAAAQTQVQALLASLSGPGELADAAELPGVLVNPPWLQKKQQRHVSTLALDPLTLASVFDFSDEEIKQRSTFSERDNKHFQQVGKDPHALADGLGFISHNIDRAATAIGNGDVQSLIEIWHSQPAGDSYWDDFNMHYTSSLPDEMALALWNSLSAHRCRGERYMVAKFGEAALPGLINAVQARPTELTDIWPYVGAAELAPSIARAYLKLKTLRREAQQWLCNYPHHSAIGLLPAALGKAGETKDAATSALRMLATQGHEALIMHSGAAYNDPSVTDALRRMLDEDPLDHFPNKIGPSPNFFQPAAWRRPVLKGSKKALPNSALEHLGTMLRFPMTEGLYEGLNQVKQVCDSDSLADFAWDLFSAWLFVAAPSKESWAFNTLGLFGNDDTARKLTPFIREWPGKGQHQRAVNGLEVLNQIGSDVALMLLNGIAQKVKFKGLQDRAREKIAAIAEARELTIEELEDRLAPDLGLDENGSLRLDFGDRQFTVSFDETLKPFVRDSDGTRLKDLPKPKKSDDQELANEAVNSFKRLKKDARTVAAQQLVRLEIAMCQRRRWAPELFELFLVRHPLVRHLVQRLAWGVYLVDDGAAYGGKLVDCFRVAEDGCLTSAEDEEYALPAGENMRIGIPHALELSEQQSAAFGQLFADYELLQPFVQLGRDTYSLTEQEREHCELRRWEGRGVPTGRILGLANKGWLRGDAQDGGMILDFIKPIDHQLGFNLTFDPGIYVGMANEEPQQELMVVFISEDRCYWQQTKQASPFAHLDDIVLSELIRDMENLIA